MNPMIRKELNLRMRERRGWILPSLYLLTLAAVAVLPYYFITQETNFRELQGADVGVPMFLGIAYAQMALLLLLAPIFSAGSVTIEKEQRTLPLLLTSLLSPLQIWWGKFVSSLMFILLLIVIGLPMLSLTFAFGGVGPWEVLMATVSTVVAMAAISALGIYWSSVFRRTVHATAVTYATVIVLTLVTGVITMITAALVKDNSGGWAGMPWRVKFPLFFNPIFFLTMGFAPARQLYPEWLSSLGIFIFLSLGAVVLAVWNIERKGDVS